MSTFKKNLIADCFNDGYSFEDGRGVQADQVAVTCESFETRINDLLDDRINLSSDCGLQNHADECLSCRQTLQKYEQLEFVLGVERKSSKDVGVACLSDSNVAQQQVNRGLKLSTKVVSTAIVAAMVSFVFAGQYFFIQQTTEEAVTSVAVTSLVPETNLIEIESGEVAVASQEGLTLIEDVSWAEPDSVGQLLVNSGSEWLAARREQQDAVIQGFSDVRLELETVEAQLVSLQPVLNYSGRIPALTPMQGTVCFTLGWLKKDKVDDQPEVQQVPDTETELGMQKQVSRELV